MPTFKIKYIELQQREWEIDVQASSLEEAEQLFENNNENPWNMVMDEQAAWSLGSDEEGFTTDTYETNWEIEESE